MVRAFCFVLLLYLIFVDYIQRSTVWCFEFKKKYPFWLEKIFLEFILKMFLVFLFAGIMFFTLIRMTENEHCMQHCSMAVLHLVILCVQFFSRFISRSIIGIILFILLLLFPIAFFLYLREKETEKDSFPQSIGVFVYTFLTCTKWLKWKALFKMNVISVWFNSVRLTFY